ncbi:MarR family winged helix-turn-helix transcriptional regulator [Patulibacter americanus]|uniref:MarR family winged helix-turn-helix transcriptional regulator n=1 Tax=Patulibacter americanus TaxID=588672 RepID=UPI0003B5ADFF|nr:MarR family transcriptional regulator [Patulibacter americanus]
MECSDGPDTTWALTTLPAGVADRTGLLLIKVAFEMERRGVDRLRPLGLDGRDYTLLAVLSRDDAGSQAELATLCGLLPAQLVPVLDALEAKGFAERRRDERDRRRSIVRITDEGREVLARADEIASAVERELLGDVGEELRERLARTVDAALRDPAPAG